MRGLGPADGGENVVRFCIGLAGGAVAKGHLADGSDQALAVGSVDRQMQPARDALLWMAVEGNAADAGGESLQERLGEGFAFCASSACRSAASLQAAAKPTTAGTFNVPDRSPPSWPPPRICAGIPARNACRLRKMHPAPFGPYSLCAEIVSASSCIRWTFDRQPADPLACVAVQQHASGCADPGQLGDRIYGVDHVAGGDDGNAAGVFGQDGRELLGPNLSEAVGTKPTDADPPRLFEASDRFQNRFVLDRRGDDVTWAVAAAGQPGDGQVVGLGGRRGEDDRAAATADRFGNRLPACSTASRAVRPKMCGLAGLPNCSRKNGSMASRTASSICVVALLSR